MIDPLDRPPPPSRRRPRRPDVMTYQVRVDLAGTTPPTWRRLEVASDVFLDDLHEIIQIAFGWTDSHLHRFGCGPAYYSDDTEYYLMDFEVDGGEMGIPEQQVRLDEVLADIGDHDVVGGAHNEEHQRRAAAAPAAGTGQSSREARACHTARGGVRPRRGAVVAIRREIDTTVVILAGSQPYPRFAARLSTQAPAPRGRSRIQSYSTMEVADANDAAIEHHTPKRHG